MTVEHHPLYHRWRVALENLIAAKEQLRLAANLGPEHIARAEKELARARLEYHLIGDEL
jgi:hypothetical protein